MRCATAVIEGAGDHCCEYMTGGVVDGGPQFRGWHVGRHRFVLDEVRNFPDRVNPELVDLERVGPKDESELRSFIEEHVAVTGSERGRAILENWGEQLLRFWRVVPDPPTVQSQTPAMEVPIPAPSRPGFRHRHCGRPRSPGADASAGLRSNRRGVEESPGGRPSERPIDLSSGTHVGDDDDQTSVIDFEDDAPGAYAGRVQAARSRKRLAVPAARVR